MLPVLFSILFVFTSQTRYDISFNDISLLPHPLTLPGHFITFESFNLTYLESPKSFTVSYTPTEFFTGFDSNEITLKADATFNTSFWWRKETVPLSTSLEGNLEFSRLNDASPWRLGKNCTLNVKIFSIFTILKCSYFTSLFGTELKEQKKLSEELTYPELLPNATEINNVRMIMAVKNMMKGINELIPFKLSFSTPESTGVHLEVTAVETLNILFNKTVNELRDLVKSGMSILHEVESYLPSNAQELLNEKLNELTELFEKITVDNGPIEGTMEFNLVIPAGAKIDIDIGFRGFGCDKHGEVCAFPSYKGLSLIGISLSGFGDLDGISAVMPELLESMNSKLSDAITSFCDQDTGLCVINLPFDKPTITPPRLLLILFPIVSAILIIVIVNVNVIRHIKNPVVNYENTPISITRIVCEDTLFCIFVAGTVMMFICSDVTTAATVVIGNEITMYNFSLMNTVHDLWFGGLKPLSVLVMLFSGIYPYFKLVCMLLCTVILHCPDSRILKIIDSIGKYSYIDIFVMVIMASGLCIDNIAVAIMRPAFFLFVVATTASIIAGNYGVHLWRMKTSIRRTGYRNARATMEMSLSTKQFSIEPEKMLKQSVNGDNEFAELNTRSGNLYDINYNDTPMNDDVKKSTSKRRVWWLVSIPSAIVVLALTLPVCLWTCLSFSVDGLAHIIFPTDRKFTILVIAAKAHWLCLVIVIYTILIAPFLNALLFPSMCFFNTWTAADVFLLACVAGLVQLNRFVQFMLGGNYNFAYSIHAHLHVTLIPLLIAAVLTWVIYLVYVFNCRQCHKKQK